MIKLPKLPGQKEPPKLPPSPFKGITLLETKKLPTPFGTVETPSIELPPLKLPKLESRHGKALAHALGVDLADIVGVIPYVGSTLADSLRRMHSEEIRKILTSDEFDKYAKWDRTYPDVLALLRSRLP
ncbi:unnamed protein product [marine sediment metagenome]|uniref:Uncharacterized protein n=1 Tax=marine sediment metagenome TaxID=412755 RepID=X1TCM1_9ZZZZ